MRRLSVFLAVLLGSATLIAMAASPAGAYGSGANHDMWQIGVSFNCNNPDPTICPPDPQTGEAGTGGFWGWAEFDRSVDQTTTWGDAQFAGCGHTVGGIGGPGGAGAGHISVEIESWTIKAGSAGPETFFANGEETDFGPHGFKQTSPFTDLDTGFPATPGHYSASDIFGFTAPPGVAIEIQVAFRAAK